MRTVLYYTFGNHMHWVDMQWLWGYAVLPGSVDDMLRLCREAGVRGNVNFDAVGYEKMAAECPEALAALRQAVAAGTIEPVGCSYGQPYGLLHGGESNIRQLTYGVRATRRLLGVRPRAFWEEEFYFFPQLPQLLAQCGYTGACLFFQWTWHTPEVPREPHSLILWEGIDGTRLATLPRNDLNVHQWPEDFDGLLDKVPVSGSGKSESSGERPPAIVQWLELMPSRDWMCRSELLLPRLRALASDERFELRPRTVSQLIAELSGFSEATSPPRRRGTAAPDAPGIPVRAYTMDDVWHGMTLGKNADRHPRRSHQVEAEILRAESVSALAGLFGRPYASWDVYPTWELEEAWRLTLAAQHHDNHECEGLCGFIGHGQFDQGESLAAEVSGRASWLLHKRSRAALLQFNGLGWGRTVTRDLAVINYEDAVHVPPFGYAARRAGRRRSIRPRPQVTRRAGRVVISTDTLSVEIDALRGTISQIRSARIPGLRLGKRARVGAFGLGGRTVNVKPRITIDRDEGRVRIEQYLPRTGMPTLIVSLVPERDAIDIRVLLGVNAGSGGARDLRPGLNRSLQMGFDVGFATALRAGTPLAAGAISPRQRVRRKYPSGDWMTAPQWFETLERPFTSSGFLDLVDPETDTGVLVCHESCVQWFRDKRAVRAVLTAHDPWDESRYDTGSFYDRSFRVIPHAGLRDSDRARAAMEFASDVSAPRTHWGRPVGGGTASGVKKDIPPAFGPLSIENAPGVLAHAFFRESMKSGEHLPDWAGHRMFTESGGACDHPFVIRLVEWDGEPAEVTLKLAGPVALAAKTNLLGEVLADQARTPGLSESASEGPGSGFQPSDTRWLNVEHSVAPPEWAGSKQIVLQGKPLTWSAVRFTLRPREIATIYADMVLGRKQWRDLDAKREVWATVHKQK